MRGEKSSQVSGISLSETSLECGVRERGHQASPPFLLPPVSRIWFLVKGHHLVRTPRIHPLKLGPTPAPPQFLSPLWLPLSLPHLC